MKGRMGARGFCVTDTASIKTHINVSISFMFAIHSRHCVLPPTWQDI